METYTRDMLIRDALLLHEGAAAIFERHGLGCGHCLAAEMETLAAVATMHDIPVEILLADLKVLENNAEEGD